MKGVVFTEFLDMVAGKFGDDMVDDIIEDCNLPSGGAYTQVGTYDHTEIVALVGALSERTNVEVPTLLTVYGSHLFTRFYALYPVFFDGVDGAFQFLSAIENYIHVEVKKLYPDAELPSFDVHQEGPDKLVMVYHSSRHFEDLAQGLIQGALDHFDEKCTIDRVDGEGDEGSTFTLTRVSS